MVGSRAQGPYLFVQSFLPLGHNSFPGLIGSRRRVTLMGPMRGQVFVWRNRAYSSQASDSAVEKHHGASTVKLHLAAAILPPPHPNLLAGSLCWALRSTAHLPIWPDEEQRDCFIKRESLRKRKWWIKGGILRITDAFELSWEDQKWAAWKR